MLKVIICILLLPNLAYAKLALGIIPVQTVSSGEEYVLDMHRFYHPEKGTRFRVSEGTGYSAKFDEAAFKLRLKILPESSGLLDVPIAVTNRKGQRLLSGVVTLAIKSRHRHIFSYTPSAPVKKVVVAGSFNGWSQGKNPMLDKDGDGTFTAKVWIDPGSYMYKFVADGQWLQDKANPEKTADGFGGFNSNLQIGSSLKDQPLTIYASEKNEDEVKVRIIDQGSPIKDISAIIQARDGSIFAATYKKNNNEIVISAIGIPEGSWIRVAVSDQKGRISNVVRMHVAKSPLFQWQDAIIYSLLTDRFFNGDEANDSPVESKNVLPPANYHGGDWSGIRQKIKDGYFEEIGVNVLWISPHYRNPTLAYQEYQEPHRWYSGYHGYWPVSTTKVEPRFGNAEELKLLITEAHNHGIKVLFDLVLNHIHQSHPYWKKNKNWFSKLKLPDGTQNLRRWDSRPFTTWFEPFLPSFDFNNKDAVEALIENAVWWLKEFKPDGFRLGAVKHIPQHFWWKLRSRLRENLPKDQAVPLYLVGETFMSRQEISSYVGPNMLSAQFDFPLYDSIKSVFSQEKSGFGELDNSLSQSEWIYGKETLMSTLLGNHDKSRFMAYADGDLPDPNESNEAEVGWNNPPGVEDPNSYKRLLLAMTFLMTIDGVPMIYYGDEFGMTGAADPDNRRDMRFGGDLTKHEKNVFDTITKLTHIRNEHPSLRYGSRRTVLAEKEIYAYIRTYFNDRVLVVINRSTQLKRRKINVSPELSNGVYTNLINGKTYNVKAGKINILLRSRSSVILVKTGGR